MRKLYATMRARLRAVRGVLTARRYVVVTYDPKQPPNVLGTIYLGGPCQEIPTQLAAATDATRRWAERTQSRN